MTRRALITTFGVTGVTMGLSLITSVVLARNLGPEGRGLLLALTFWPALWTALSNLSLNEATCFHVARSGAADGGPAQRNFEVIGSGPSADHGARDRSGLDGVDSGHAA